MMTFYHAPQSRSGRTMWLIEELGVPYETRYVPIVYGGGPGDGGAGSRAAGNAHPDGKVPAIVDNGALVTEGIAIAIHLTDLHPAAGIGAPVGTADRGAFLAWLAWNASEFEPLVAMLKFVPNALENPRTADSLVAVMRRIDQALAAGPYLMGDRFTAVDVMIGATIGWGREVLPENAALDAYLARIADRPAHAAACAKDAPADAVQAA
ncbi:MAG: glutathione S-transferase N-terminal domain-containing protein [Pseudomonadota bacterium]|uniref:glutathione S-transferase family protein n=1 Tax=Sphingomonas sp. ERG5 TaxID=1381597 RepID=UPI00054BEA5D|nr:glutathione S-transferase N-terminal domain-containing protein [Sphingomonas sp. ERG5]